MNLLAEIAYPRIDPVLLDLGKLKVRWYGLSYVLAFVLAYFVLRMLVKRGRWGVAAERVMDILFWGVLGVFIGGRLGYIFFYMIPFGEFSWGRVIRVWEGGMSFHGGLIGVIAAYLMWAAKHKKPLGDLFDGLSLATAPGLFVVRMANFINAELFGTVTDLPWAMRFPAYAAYPSVDAWEKAGGPYYTEARHPSQLYEAFGEGILLYVVMHWLMLRRDWGGGRIAGTFLVGYGIVRFCIEYVRLPDHQLGRYVFGLFTQGQLLCGAMIVAGIVIFVLCHIRNTRPRRYDPETGEALGFLDETRP